MGYEYYDYGYNAGSAVGTGLGVALGILTFIYIISLVIGIFTIICNWKVYKKAGRKGWEAIIPIYNIVVLLEITNLPMWYIALFFIPIGNVIAMFLIYIELAKKFGKSAAFGVGLVFLNTIFMAILAFNKNCVYEGSLKENNNQSFYNNQPVGNSPQNQPMEQPVFTTVSPVMPEVNQTIAPVMPEVNQNVSPVMPVTNEAINPVGPENYQMPVQNSVCPKCGSHVNPGDRFCMNCGNQLN